ncbi:beta-glucoside kinase [Listeria rocourtiae FSL F6-920]|nr:beta-glucoside kinase [Listeria rocourtiae FSL F6-920]
MKTIAAFDIGGTTLKMGLVSSEGNIIQHEKITIPNFDGELILAGISEYTKKTRCSRRCNQRAWLYQSKNWFYHDGWSDSSFR